MIPLILLIAAGCAEQATQKAEQAIEKGQAKAENAAKNAAKNAAGDVAQKAEDKAKEGAQNFSSGSSPSSAGEARTVTVTYVTDGDTVEIEPAVMNRTTIRLIGVDTPESAIPGKAPEPRGEAAAGYTKSTLEGQQVTLTLGQESVDPYDRLLGNVRLSGSDTLHAENLLAKGLAQDLFYSPNTANQAHFESIQEQAREEGQGIWGIPLSKQCELSNRDNGIGEGSAGC